MFGRKTHFGLFTFYFLIGGIIGAAAALLLAPTTGKKLQKQVKEVLGDKIETIRKVANA